MPNRGGSFIQTTGAETFSQTAVWEFYPNHGSGSFIPNRGGNFIQTTGAGIVFQTAVGNLSEPRVRKFYPKSRWEFIQTTGAGILSQTAVGVLSEPYMAAGILSQAMVGTLSKPRMQEFYPKSRGEFIQTTGGTVREFYPMANGSGNFIQTTGVGNLSQIAGGILSKPRVREFY